MKSNIFIGIITFLIITVSCATQPGSVSTYQQKSADGYGYSEMIINDTTYRVSFSANEFTERNNAYLFFLTRCAEITKNNNCDYFTLKNFTDQSIPGQTTASGYSVPYSAGGISYNIKIPKASTLWLKPNLTGEIQIYNGKKGVENEFDANAIYTQGMELHRSSEKYNKKREEKLITFESSYGLYAGIGNSAGIGIATQIGYFAVPNANNRRWAVLLDYGLGYRYGLKNDSYSYTFYNIDEKKQTKEIDYIPNRMDCNFGVLGEYYFIPNLGLAAGFGIGSGAGGEISYYDGYAYETYDSFLTPYIRLEVNYLMKYIKLGIGYDNIFWKNQIAEKSNMPSPPDIPAGWRINLFSRFRVNVETLGQLLKL